MSEQTSKTISIVELDLPTWPETCKGEVEEILKRYPDGRERSAIMPLLHLAMRERSGHYVAISDLQAIAEIMGTSTAYVDSVCSFYAMYHRHPVGKYLVTVCGSMGCHLLNGGRQLVEHMEETLGIKHGETTADGLVTLEVTPECLAACDLAPVMHVNVEYAVKMTPARWDGLLEALRSGAGPEAYLEKQPLMGGVAQAEWQGFREPPAPAAEQPAAEAAPTAEAPAAVEETPEAVVETAAAAEVIAPDGGKS